MNDGIGELKNRLRRMRAMLSEEGGVRILKNLDFAQAVSRADRLMRAADRTRDPSRELRDSIEHAEMLGRSAR
ncbi:MAG TPA: hypothetical protein VFI16_06735 [Anaeromyxobacteraceae bacterium]|nr:hypothetical protein [Anaeromyxobacteraceae bacterium]